MTRAAYALIVSIVLSAGLLVLVFAAPNTSRSGAVEPNDFANLAFHPHPGSRLPLAAHLVDERGRPVALREFFKKSPVIVVLEYLRCTSLCGVTLRNLISGTLARLPLEPGRDYELVAISIDPRDKPADAAAAQAKYARLLDRKGVGSGMHFLTGAPAEIRKIADTIGFPYRYDSLLQAYIHPAGFIIASPDGLISRYVVGIAITPNELIGALADAEQDKSQGPLTRLLLLCHIQGAPLGRFTIPVIAAFTAADIAAAFTVLGIFVTIRRRRYG